MSYGQDLAKFKLELRPPDFSNKPLTKADNKIKSALVRRLDRASFVAKCATIERVEKARKSQVRIWIRGAA